MTSTAPPASTHRDPLTDGVGLACLDGLEVAVLVADASLRVVYGNLSARRALRGVAPEIEREFGTRISDVVGVPLHHLFGDAGRVTGPDQLPRVSTVTVGQAILRVHVSGLRNTRGDPLGYSAQFADITIETQKDSARRAQAAEADSREQRQLEELRCKTEGMLGAVQAAMAGDLTHPIEVRGDDALAHIAANLAGLFCNLRTSVGSIGAVAQELGTAADALDETSRHMGDNAGSTAKQAAAAANAADAVSSNISTVAAGTEELGASIREIARSAAHALRIASDAVDAAEQTNNSIHKLGASSAEIGNVVKVITSIAQQTNLLALNATIEAARAGDAGRGFAVVANEVKELAKETAKATDDIGRRIEAIQTGTKGAIEAIKRISEIIDQVNALQTSIATAVEEQSATTNEISRSIAQAAAGAAAISTTVSEVAQSAGDTSRNATNMRGAAADLTRLAVDLRDLISGFTV